MNIQVTKYDTADYLTDRESIVNYLEESFKSNDIEIIMDALDNVTRSEGFSKISQDTGLSRTSLYKTFQPSKKPKFDTVLKVMTSLGLGFHVESLNTNQKVAVN